MHLAFPQNLAAGWRNKSKYFANLPRLGSTRGSGKLAWGNGSRATWSLCFGPRRLEYIRLRIRSKVRSSMANKPTTVDEYLAQLPEDRRQGLQQVRKVILKNLPKGYEEGIQYGMIGYFVPHSLYPSGYHCDTTQPLPFLHIASQKNHMAVYMFCLYIDESEMDWFQDAWAKTGKKLDMGKSCVRFKKVDDLPLPLIGQAVKRVPVTRFIASYESGLSASQRAAAARKGTAKKSVAKKKTAQKKTATAKATAVSKQSPAVRKKASKKSAATSGLKKKGRS